MDAPVHLENAINQVSPSAMKIALTASEAAELLGVSMPTMYELVRSRRIPAVHVGKKILISRQAIQDWLMKGES